LAYVYVSFCNETEAFLPPNAALSNDFGLKPKNGGVCMGYGFDEKEEI
jgi:hypothetical protein